MSHGPNEIVVYSRALRTEVFEPDYAGLGLDAPGRRGPGTPFLCVDHWRRLGGASGAEEADDRRRRKDAALIVRAFTAKRFKAEVILCGCLGAVGLPVEVAKILADYATWLVGV